MSIATDPTVVRQLVRRTFCTQLATTSFDPLELDERVSIDRGRIVARSYRYGPLFAMWLVDIGLVQFYDGDGALRESIDVRYSPATRRAA